MSGRRLRITVIGVNYAPEASGNAPYTTALAEGLAARGHRVTVLTGYPHYPQWRVRDGYTGSSMEETIGGVTVKRLRHYVPSHPTNLRRALMELSFGLRTVACGWGNPDVVLFVSPALISTACGLVRARLGRTRSAVWVQDLYSLGAVETGTTPGAVARVLAALESRTLSMAHRTVAIHERFRRHICSRFGVPAARVEVVRNWTHLDDGAPLPEVDAVRRSMGWAEDDIVVLHAGNMGVKQGLENVVKAASLASAHDSPVRFVLLGDGNQATKLNALGGSVPRLSFADPVDDGAFQGVLAAADILLVNELPGVAGMSVPSKLTSYFNSGRPVLAATDAGSTTACELEESGGGLRVEAGEPGQLLEAAERLGRDPELGERLGDAGLAYRRDNLEAAGAVARFEELLATLASGEPAPAVLQH